jgi:hypothetical protein
LANQFATRVQALQPDLFIGGRVTTGILWDIKCQINAALAMMATVLDVRFPFAPRCTLLCSLWCKPLSLHPCAVLCCGGFVFLPLAGGSRFQPSQLWGRRHLAPLRGGKLEDFNHLSLPGHLLAPRHSARAAGAGVAQFRGVMIDRLMRSLCRTFALDLKPSTATASNNDVSSWPGLVELLAEVGALDVCVSRCLCVLLMCACFWREWGGWCDDADAPVTCVGQGQPSVCVSRFPLPTPSSSVRW